MSIGPSIRRSTTSKRRYSRGSGSHGDVVCPEVCPARHRKRGFDYRRALREIRPEVARQYSGEPNLFDLSELSTGDQP